ncbi:unnamed protein product [Lepeophtheirus salmonis]|uniref:(salmon louse) hypothetical protein n=1 Tax=Lepeophtheirus salmonis TaxID=72036 RepID=A0A7R8D778_LEPSM|nr:unnamed protein product [Lepeophtheirus salmonis]CAF3046122.1 unnamed protein product [Lepeophtheirus salmonis]
MNALSPKLNGNQDEKEIPGPITPVKIRLEDFPSQQEFNFNLNSYPNNPDVDQAPSNPRAPAVRKGKSTFNRKSSNGTIVIFRAHFKKLSPSLTTGNAGSSQSMLEASQ